MAWENSCNRLRSCNFSIHSNNTAIKSSCILSKLLCQIKSAHRGDEGGVINEDIMVFQEQDFFIQSSPDAFEDLP